MLVFIDIFLFVILISSIIAFSPVGKLLVEYLLGKNSSNDFITLQNKYQSLEAKVLEQEKEIDKLRESLVFYDDKMKKLQNNFKSETDKNVQSQNINKININKD